MTMRPPAPRPSRLLIAAAMIAALHVPATSGHAQTLAERIEIVRQRNAEQANARPRPASRVRLLQALFYTTVSTQFEATPARDAFEYLQTVLGENLIVRYADDATGLGIDPATPITLKVRDLAVVDVLDLILEQCATLDPCTWQLRPGFIEAGTKDQLGAPAARMHRVYSIGELISEPARFEESPTLGLGPRGFDGLRTTDYYAPAPGRRSVSGSFGPGVNSGPATPAERQAQRAERIIEMIVSTIEPSAWARNGGEIATIRFHDGALVVHAPDFVQRQIRGYPRVPPPRAKDAEAQEEPTPPSS